MQRQSPMKQVFIRLSNISRQTLAVRWSELNGSARSSYRTLARKNPRIAELLKRTFYPILLFGNRKILKSNYVYQTRRYDGEVGSIMAFQNLDVASEFAPLVSILVPNYNHAEFLEQRLESIFSQSYANYEVLLMDDCSTDTSREILQKYAEKYPDKARTLFNDENSGGVFYQWEKGLNEARGELIWIAESDDWADRDLLSELVPFFKNPAVQLAYARTAFMDASGKEEVWSMDAALDGLDKAHWDRPFVCSAPEIVKMGFAERNIVPNVSSAVFRKIERLEVLGNDEWRVMRTCGDWLFYLNLIRGGCLAFSPTAINYYRLHSKNTSRNSYSDDAFYREHQVIAECLARHYNVPSEVLRQQSERLQDHWRANRKAFDESAYKKCYDLAQVVDGSQNRKPNLLMAGYGFCAGGGETFPIQLANLMKTAGYNVTFLDCAQEEEVAEIRAMLAADIPVVTDLEGLNEICEAFEIDIIHSHHAWVDSTILDLLPEDSDVKTVITLHGMYETIPPSALNSILPRLVQRTDKFVYTANKNLEALRNSGLAENLEIERIDNALEVMPVSPVSREEIGIPEDAFVLTTVARAIESKGWEEAISAVELARNRSKRDIQLILIGEGPVYDNLLLKNLPSYIHLLGFKPNIRDYFAASDLGFIPSRFKGESFPLVLIDCLLAGRPLLTSNVGEIEYMLATEQGPAGRIFELDNWKINVSKLSDEICLLANNEDIVASLEARVKMAAMKFDPALMRDAYDSIYTRVGGVYSGSQ